MISPSTILATRLRVGLLFSALLVCSLMPRPVLAQNLIDTEWDLRPVEQAAARDTQGPATIYGMPLPPAGDFDIPLADPAATVAKIKTALAHVFQHSQVAAAGIERLARYGTIKIIYDAAFPKPSLNRVVIAGFMPQEFTPQLGKKDFTVLVGRFGANWEVDELAAALVHELIGHGIQRLENRFGHDRPIDLECEARLWQQMYFTDADMPQDTRYMVDFRNTTDRLVCHDFRRFVAKAKPKMMAAWDRGRPDMPGLLGVFQQYYALLRQPRRRSRE